MTFAGYTVAQLRDFVRELTGIFSTDLVSNATIESWINEAYFDLLAQQVWPFAPSTVEALVATDYPPFVGTSHRLLAYKAAAMLLETQADDTPRIQEYKDVYTVMVAALYQNTLNAASTGDVDTQAKMIRLVRELIDIFDNSVTDTFISRKLDDEYNQLFDSYTWTQDRSTFRATLLANAYGRILSYGVASRLAATYEKPEGMVQAMRAEYESILEQLKVVYLYTNAATTNPSTLGALRKQVRSLLQDFSKDTPDSLINAWINDAYTSLVFEREWEFMWFDFTFTLNTSQDSYDFGGQNIRRVLGLYNVSADGYDVKPVTRRAELFDIEKNNTTYYYMLDSAGHIKIYPTPTESVTMFGRGVVNHTPLLLDTDAPIFGAQFGSILAYRAAIMGLLFDSNNNKIIGAYQKQAENVFDAMVRYYQLDTSTDAFSIGSTALERRKYIPYFRVS